MTLFDFLKNIFLLLLFACLTPILIEEIKFQYAPFFELHTQIGIITINNVIHDSSNYTTQLYSLFNNPYIKGIVIKINSSESFSASSQAIFHEIQYLKRQYPKPIVALIENRCIGGSYLIASSCDYIIAPQSALIGGIGLEISDLQLKNISIGEKTTASTLQNNIYQQFLNQVATARKLSLTTIDRWADGTVCTGSKAVELGLITMTGSIHNAIEVLKEKALIDGEIEWISAHHCADSISPFEIRAQYRKVLKSTAGFTSTV
jgi:ClpP class serine protease